MITIRKKKILVVDDEPKIRHLFGEVLEEAGYLPIEARNGQSALDVLKESAGEIDLVLLDLTMPTMDGEEFFEAVKHKMPEIKVIVASGIPVDDQKLLIFSADDYFDKSDSVLQLLTKIEALLQAQRIERENSL